MMTTVPEKIRRKYMAIATVAVIMAMLLLTLTATPHEAGATFPGHNGKLAFASNRTTGEGVNNPEGDYEIFTMDRNGSGLRQLTENAAFDFDPEWSPDGQKIAFESDRALFSEIFVMNADGTEQTQVTANPDFSFDRSPTFSQDGAKIAFESNRAVGEGVDNPEKDREIFSIKLDGSGLQQLTHDAARDFHPDFAPNGNKIAFVSDRDFAPGIYSMNSDGTKQKKVSRSSGTVFESPGWAPDGKKIAFTSNRDGGDDVYAMHANGSGQVRITINGLPRDAGSVYSPRGRKLAFESDREGNFEIYKMRLDGTKLVNLTNDPAGDFTPDWQPLESQ
jgi:TolB protein